MMAVRFTSHRLNIPRALAALIIIATLYAQPISSRADANAPATADLTGGSQQDGAANVVSCYTSADGLPQNSVKDVVQTPDGYVWAGTQEGLARFDGVKFTVFNTLTSRGLVSNNVHQLVVDSAGSLWVLANTGVSRYRNRVFEDVTPPDTKGVDRMLYLWHGQDGRVYADSDTWLFRSCEHGFEKIARLADCVDQERFFFDCAPDGTVWLLGQRSQRLVSISNGRIQKYDEAAHGPYSGMCVDSQNNLWLAGKRLWSMKPGGALQAAPNVAPAGTASVQSLLPNSDGGVRFWIGSRLYTYRFSDGGPRAVATCALGPLSCRNDQNGNYWAIFENGSQYLLWVISHGRLSQFNVSSQPAIEWLAPVLRSRDGVCFVGTYSGLAFVHRGRCRTYGIGAGVPDGEIQSVYQTHDGVMWVAGIKSVGTMAGGKYTRSADPNLRNADVNSMTEDTRGALWLSTASNHLWRVFEGKSADCRALIRGVNPKTPITALARASDGGIWCGIGNCLVHFDGQRSVVHPTAIDSCVHCVPYCIMETRDGRVIVGGQQGFACFNRTHFDYYSTEEGLPNVPVIAAYQDDRGQVWLGLWGGGLARFKNNNVVWLSTRDGLYADSIHSIVPGDRNILWLGSSKGIFSVNVDQLTSYAESVEQKAREKLLPIDCSPLQEADGMLGGQCAAARQPLAVRSVDGSLWFACMRGVVQVVTVVPGIRESDSLPVMIEEAKIDNRAIALDGRGVARPGSGSLEVDYTALNFMDADKTRFMYRLDGFDTQWTDADTRRVAYYTNIPPGRYRFEVIACDSFGHWNRTGAEVSFTIQPHYYETLWFRLLVGVAGLMLVAGAVVFRVRQLSRLNRMLEERVAERTRELGHANSQLWESREEVVAQNEELRAIQSELEQRNEELAQANTRLNDLATVDALTGLKNRRLLEDRLEYSFRIAARYGSELAVVMIDVDSFKSYNDTFGHPAGDEVLKRIAAILNSIARDTDLLARYGGEEFTVVMPLTGIDGARQVAERMRAAIEAEEWPLRSMTASFGIAGIRPEMKTASELTQSADEALYEAKRTGKNRVAVHARPLFRAAA